MKILLVFVPALVRNNKFEVLNSPPLALYVLSACVKKAGYEVEIIDPCEFLIFDKKDNLVEKTYKFICSRMESCDVIAFSSNTFNWGITKEILDSIINDKKSKRIILGGLHPTIFDKHVLESTCADYVIRGEGEKTLPHLLDAINHKQDVESIPGITYKIDGVIYRNEDAKPLTVDEWKAMPYPDYSLLPINNPYLYIPVESSRGCHFNCAFCSIPHRHNWRALPAEEVVDRVKYALKETARTIYNRMYEGLSKVGHAVNNPYTVLGDSISAGRLYDKIGTNATVKGVMVISYGTICKISKKKQETIISEEIKEESK